LNKTLIATFIFLLVVPTSAFAEPVVGGIPLPPASFTFIDNTEILRTIGLDGFDGAWCYDNHANAILITAPSRERAQCELKYKYEIEKMKVKHQFEVDKLNIRIETLIKQHEEISLVRDQEIDKLTEAALKRPNDYSAWWASGGLVVGVLSTILITMAVNN
tara:strand:+ start:85 stop:567 length:483 start_codon:yes stop_codon:yes gene_type:complete